MTAREASAGAFTGTAATRSNRRSVRGKSLRYGLRHDEGGGGPGRGHWQFRARGCRFLQSDVKAEASQSLDQAAHHLWLILLIEVVGTQLAVILAPAQQRIDNQQQLVSQSKEGLLVPQPAALPAIERGQIRGFAAAGAPSRLT